MSEQPVVYPVPTHLTTREPFVFGRSLDEFAKLIAVACVALKLAFSDGLPVPVRLPLVGLVIVVGIAWALLRVQRYSLDSWLGLAFRFGASPRRRVWRPTSSQVANQLGEVAETLEHGAGWQNLEHIRVRWAEQPPAPAGHGSPTLVLVSNKTERG